MAVIRLRRRNDRWIISVTLRFMASARARNGVLFISRRMEYFIQDGMKNTIWNNEVKG